jgi:hypothetical protein
MRSTTIVSLPFIALATSVAAAPFLTATIRAPPKIEVAAIPPSHVNGRATPNLDRVEEPNHVTARTVDGLQDVFGRSVPSIIKDADEPNGVDR